MLRSGDEDAWDSLCKGLWPTVYSAAYKVLSGTFPEDVEDVGIEALEEISEKLSSAQSIDELPKLATRIARNKAVSHWRSMTAKKRGSGRTTSLEAQSDTFEPHAELPGLEKADLKDIQKILTALQEGLKQDYKAVLHDFFIEDLSYKEISEKRNWPVGTVGINLRRGLKAIREQRAKFPELVKEALNYLRLLFW